MTCPTMPPTPTRALALLLLAACSTPTPPADIELPAGGTATPVTTVYALRHAEKAEGQGDDPGLSTRGQQRAVALAELLGGEDIAAVFATEYQRTRRTVEPLAVALGQDVVELPARDPSALTARIRADYPGRTVVAAGHSNTVPAVIEELGVDESVTLAESDYGDLYVVTVQPDGTASLERRRFGD